MKPIYWSANDSLCEICGREFPNGMFEAEMYDEDKPEDPSIICHRRCGRREGLRED